MKVDSKIKLSGKTLLVIGLIIAVTGVVLFGLTWFNVLTREQTLGDANLSVEERWRIEGSLQWWRDFGVRLSYPLAAALSIGGLAVMIIALWVLQRE